MSKLGLMIAPLEGYEYVEELITSSKSWTVPADMVGTFVYLTMIGGGAAGSAQYSWSSGYVVGHGGNSGEFVEDLFIDIKGHTGTIPITIGAGGSSVNSSTGNVGGPSSFGGYYTVLGGANYITQGNSYRGGQGKYGNSYGSSNEGGGPQGGRLAFDNEHTTGGHQPGGGGGGGGIITNVAYKGRFSLDSDENGRGFGAGGGGAGALSNGSAGIPRGGYGADGAVLIKYLRKLA